MFNCINCTNCYTCLIAINNCLCNYLCSMSIVDKIMYNLLISIKLYSRIVVSQTQTMKIVLILLLATILVVDCLPHRHNDNGKGMGKARPCGGEDNIEVCECQDGSTYDNKDDLKENCGRHSGNDILSCKCLDGETWTPPKKRGKPGRGKGKEHGKGPKGPKPCGGENNLEECECQDGSNYDNKKDLMKFCGHLSNNDIVSCSCKDGGTWTLPEKPDGKGPKGPKPCGGENNLEECECQDGSNYDNKKDLMKYCGHRSNNDIVSCTCKDGEIWTLPKKPDGKGPKGPKPCDGENNLEECECQDGSNYDNKKDLMKYCGHRSNNDIVSCTCKDGETWTLPKKPERPCMERGNIQSCTCEDGETYESQKDLKKHCKDDVNPIESCQCRDGTIWEPASGEKEDEEKEEEYEENYEDDEDDKSDEEED